MGGHYEVEDEVDVEYQNIPGQEGFGEVQMSERRQEMPESVGPSEVDQDEE